ncbi:MAG: type II toxin-antitoxin system PemK/MazF family toxin [Prevotella sp.]|nr:type II toxin-antitoxin system PemK/MazF family toxin [Prevotella sp.]
MENKTELDTALERLKNIIESKPPKTKKILTEWINTWSNFLLREGKFSPKFLPYCKRGDVVYVDFGFNVGSEYGGVHYAVVLENNNNKTNGNIIVVPLTSLDPEKSIDDISSVDVYIGNNVIEWTNSATVAKPNQIRSICKMRILKPVTSKDKRVRLTGKQLQAIDEKLRQFIFPYKEK